MQKSLLKDDSEWMEKALELAQRAFSLGEVPVGALIVKNGVAIAESYNDRETSFCALGHAEIRAIAHASKQIGAWRLSGCSLYVTLEPCLMCAGAIVQSRIDRVIIGARDLKAGAVESLYQVFADHRLNHRPSYTLGVKESESQQLIQRFFRELRKRGKTEI